jgi:hypothetical protein
MEMTNIMTTPPDDQPAPTPDIGAEGLANSEELARLWKQFHKVSAKQPEHKRLKRFVGKWAMAGEFDVYGYGPNFELKGSVECRAFFNDRFIEQRWTLTAGGDTWEVLIQLGYDTVLKKYTAMMMESIHNGMLFGEGEWREEDQSIRFWCELSNPMFNARHDALLLYRFFDDDRILVNMHVPDREGRFIEISHIMLYRLGTAEAV